MSVSTVKTVISRFLSTDTPEVLALKGAWGVGKTFAWHELIKQHKNECKLEHYSYVSLFGVSSISEIRTAIFAKTTQIEQLGEKIDAKKINEEWFTLGCEKIKRWSHKLSAFRDSPYLKNLSVGLDALAPYFVRDSIVCLDDFERLNTDRVSPEEVLGLISELKEEKRCKIVLIFNDNEIKFGDIYRRYREKVIDIELLFAPTANEAAELALPAQLPQRDLIKKYCVSLGIKNIRILRRIVGLVQLIHAQIAHLHPMVMEQAAMTLVLLAWSHYDSDKRKPTIDFILEWNRIVWGMKDANNLEEDQQRTEWSKVLREYGLLHMDEFDQSINEVVERGYFEETRFIEEAGKAHAKFQAEDLNQSFSSAWRLFHDSFADNQAQLINALVESLKKSVLHVSPLNLSSTTSLLRQLGEEKKADCLIDFYIDARASEETLFDIDSDPFSTEIRDKAVTERFRKQFQRIHPALPLAEAVKYIADNNNWSEEHVSSLSQATAGNFYDLFKQDHGEALGNIVKACLQFESNEKLKEIGRNARTALERIGKENKLNSIRVRRYGVTS